MSKHAALASPIISPLSGAAIIVFLAIAAPDAAAISFESARAAHAAGDAEAAVSEFSALAEAGDARSQFALALMYENGDGVDRDLVRAAAWYARSAHGKILEAQYRLGRLCESGYCDAEGLGAAHWYALAARSGHAEALDALRRYADGDDAEASYRLGLMYLAGWGVERDRFAAARWIERAAEQGLARAQHAQGYLCEQAIGPCAGATAALRWYGRAAEQGYRDARYNYARMVASIPAPSERFKVRAMEYLEVLRASEPDAALLYGLLFANGTLVEQDLELAAAQFRQAALLGSAQAAHNLGVMILGQGDTVTALAWMKLAAESGDQSAAAELQRLEGLELDALQWSAVDAMLNDIRAGILGDQPTPITQPIKTAMPTQ